MLAVNVSFIERSFWYYTMSYETTWYIKFGFLSQCIWHFKTIKEVSMSWRSWRIMTVGIKWRMLTLTQNNVYHINKQQKGTLLMSRSLGFKVKFAQKSKISIFFHLISIFSCLLWWYTKHLNSTNVTMWSSAHCRRNSNYWSFIKWGGGGL